MPSVLNSKWRPKRVTVQLCTHPSIRILFADGCASLRSTVQKRTVFWIHRFYAAHSPLGTCDQPTSDVRIGMNEPGYASSWRQPVLRALRESDERVLGELVLAAEHAIVLRQRELKNSTDHHEERSEMHVAIAALMTINVYKLGRRSFPHSIRRVRR